MLIEVIP